MLLLPQPGVGGNGCGNAPREIDPGIGLCLFIIGRSGHFLQAIFFIRTGQFSISGKAAPVRLLASWARCSKLLKLQFIFYFVFFGFLFCFKRIYLLMGSLNS
jgi:hypothetical protein